MKALEKDRNRRYETASGFAADVERYLDDEPVEACPPSPGTGCRSSPASTAAVLATASAFVLLLAAAALASTWQAIPATLAETMPANSGLADPRAQVPPAATSGDQLVSRPCRGSRRAPPRPRHGLPDAGLQAAATGAKAYSPRQGHRPAPR